MAVANWIKEDVAHGTTVQLDPELSLAKVFLEVFNRVWAITRVEPTDLIDDGVWHEQVEDVYILMEWLRENQGEFDNITGLAMTIINEILVTVPPVLQDPFKVDFTLDSIRKRLREVVIFGWGAESSNMPVMHFISNAMLVMARCYGQHVFGDELVDPMFIFNEYMRDWRRERDDWRDMNRSNYEFATRIARSIRNTTREYVLQQDPVEGPEWSPNECRIISIRIRDNLALVIADGVSFDQWTERMRRDYERRANEAGWGGTEVDIDERLPTIAVTHGDGTEYFFQGEEADRMLEEVPEWTDAWTYFMVTSQDW